MKKAELPIIAELGNGQMTIDEFLHLEVGDVLSLDRKIDEPLIVKVGNLPKFTAQPGHLKSWSAVQIIDVLTGGDEDDE